MNRTIVNASFLQRFLHGLFAVALGWVVLVLAALVCAGCGSSSSSSTNTTPPPTPSLKSISVTAAQPSIALGGTQQFKAAGTYSDGSTKDLTGTATWSSSSTLVATVTSAGLVSGVHSGTTTIEATSGSIGGSAALSVDTGTILTASMSTARENHTATLLNNGTVLVAGGGDADGGVLSSAEFYDPVAATFTRTGAMSTARKSHTATLLASGLVLIAGGDDGSGPVASAEIYDPAAGRFTPTGSMNAAHESHTATLLFNGMVLIAGGSSTGGSLLATAELYNPATGIFTLTGNMSSPREFHTAMALITGPSNGMVLIAGGDSGSGALASAELYDPISATFSLTGSMSAERENHTATLLNGGTVLITGGSTGSNGAALSSAEIYDPIAGKFSSTGSMAAARFFQVATLLTNGTVLVSGGKNSSGILASQELYDPDSGTFAATVDMKAPRDPFTATVITTGVNLGSVLIAGGQSSDATALGSGEIFEPITLNIVKIQQITLTPGDAGILPGASQQFTATGFYVSGGELLSEPLVSVTWSSSNQFVAAIGGRTGIARGLGFGTTNLVASLGSLNSIPTPLVVSAPSCLTLYPPNSFSVSAGVAVGDTVQLTALALYSSLECGNPSFIGSGVDQTDVATWTSSNPKVATVSSNGLITALSVGTANIQATYGGVATSLPFPVFSVSSVAITPANLSAVLPNGTTKQFQANATLSSGAVEFGVTRLTWSSSAPGVATISSAGLLTPVGPGSTTIRAVFNGVAGSTTFTIPSLASLAVTPASLVELHGSAQQFTATGVFSDGETQNYTSIAKWSSSANSVATIASTGLSDDVGLGSTTIQAVVAPVIGSTTVSAVTGSTTLTVADGGFVPTASLASPRYSHTATQFDDGTILIAGGVGAIGPNLATNGDALSTAVLYDPATGEFTQTGNMTAGRAGHTATLLNNGKVLIAGGTSRLLNPDLDIFPYDSSDFIESVASAELYDPATGEFTATGSMNTARSGHTATLLNNGMVLIAGGAGPQSNGGVATATAELYDPATGTFTPTENMISAHEAHTATLLNNGMVLIAGGNNLAFGIGKVLGNAELYDPITGIFTSTGGMSSAREYHTATLLNNGMVLLAGGDDTVYSQASDDVSLNVLATSELYDPTAGTFTPTGSMTSARHLHAATLLNNGEVLIEGGDSDGAPFDSAELYDPSAGTFSLTGFMANARVLHTATLLNNGNVLIVGGAQGAISDYGTPVAAAELFEPGTLIPPGLVSIAVTPASSSIVVGSSQHFIATGKFSDDSTEQLASVTWSSSNTSTATAGNGPGGAGIATGVSAGTATITASAGSVIGSATVTVTAPSSVGISNLTNPRYAHTATLLDNGTVLIAGGDNSVSSAASALASAELYNLAAGTFSLTGTMTAARFSHTATQLGSGLVLIAGGAGNSGPLASAELYNPATGAFTPTGNMTTTRQNHTATLLNNGMVLIVSGNDSAYFSSAELYNPATGTFTATGSLHTPRQLQTATLLNNGMVLIAGGDNAGVSLASAELYNPATGTFTVTGSMNAARVLHTATLLNDGKVLIAGGQDSNGDVLNSAELYDPQAGTFTLTNIMTVPREFQTATLLNNGTVLMAGGKSNLAVEDVLDSAEIYDPVAGIFTAAGSLSTARIYDTATLLNNGMVLLAAGETYEVSDNELAVLASAELYTPATQTPAGLVSIAVTPANPSIAVGASQALIATGTFSDNSTQQLASVTWSSSNPAVATIDNDAGDAGTAFGLAQGTATITASAGSVSGSAKLTVGPAEVESISATSGSPQSATVNTAFAAPLVATVTLGGSPAGGVVVNFTAPSTGASGSFASGVDTETTDADGVATSAAFTANATAGAYTVTASVAGTSSKASFNLTNTAVVADSASFSFYLSGLEAGNNGPHYYALAGSVAIDANGNVLAGEQDYNDGSGFTSPQPSGDIITGGSLSVNSTSGQGTLTLITNNAALGVSGTEVIGVQFVNVNHALILQFDGTATSSGSMDLQTLHSEVSGGFAFTLFRRGL
jgi:uncharacterized protein YjdB